MISMYAKRKLLNINDINDHSNLKKNPGNVSVFKHVELPSMTGVWTVSWALAPFR